jgi:glutathione S-transferase
MTSPAVVLRYFPVCGRAQALRHALADSGTDFEDLRLQVAGWAAQRMDPAFAGRHRSLPTLSWGDGLVAETLPIASFLAKRLGHYQGLDDVAIAASDAIVSSVYLDVTLRLAEVMRADVYNPGGDPVRSMAVAWPRVLKKLESLEAGLAGGAFMGGERPTMPDFFLAEAIETVRYMLGVSHQAWLEGRLPQAHALAARLRTRPALAGCWQTRPARFTARPEEDEVIGRLGAAHEVGGTA